MSYFNVSSYGLFLNEQLKIHFFLKESYTKMPLFLEVILDKAWTKKSMTKACIKKILCVLKELQTINQKELDYLLDHRSHLYDSATSETDTIDYSFCYLMFNSQHNVHLFLEKHYLGIQSLLEMISQDDFLKQKDRAQKFLGVFSKCLSVNQDMSQMLLNSLVKITSSCEKCCLTDPSFKGVSGSAQFENLMAYCNRWGSQDL